MVDLTLIHIMIGGDITVNAVALGLLIKVTYSIARLETRVGDHHRRLGNLEEGD